VVKMATSGDRRWEDRGLGGTVALTLEDRLALRSLVDAYADAVDRKDAGGVAALFTPEGRLVVPDPADPDRPLTIRVGRDQIVDALGRLQRYDALTHVVGGQLLAAAGAGLTASHVTGVTTCLANHVYEREGVRRLLVMGIHYHDTYARHEGAWRFAERSLAIGWRDDRVLGEGVLGEGAW
jgi:hypothetical protein